MKFRCEIEMDNAAFADDPLLELSKVLLKTATRFKDWEGYDPLGWQVNTGILSDYNGNKVGSYLIEGEDE